MTQSAPDNIAADRPDRPASKTQKKKADKVLQKLGERLAGLSAEHLESIEMPDDLRKALSIARETTSHGARKRHVKHVGALLRQIDVTDIQSALDEIDRGEYRKALAFQKLESWRDRLREGNTELIDEILAQCPLAQRQRLAQLARNAKKEFEADKGVKSSRALFRYLKEVSES